MKNEIQENEAKVKVFCLSLDCVNNLPSQGPGLMNNFCNLKNMVVDAAGMCAGKIKVKTENAKSKKRTKAK